MKVYKDLKRNRRVVKKAVPLAVGDNYYGFRMVGTIPELFEGEETFFKLKEGVMFNPDKQEAVLGSITALKTGLKIASQAPKEPLQTH